MDYFAALRAFVRTVDLGSFSRAATEQGVKVSTISRYVSALEADLGAALLNRSTRRLHLTEVGAAFHDRATRILGELEDARLKARSFNQSPQGLLRLNTPGAFGRRHVMPHLAAFLSAYPEIRIDVTLTDTVVDLIETGTDVAIRIGVLPDSALVARLLAPHRRLLVASPDWPGHRHVLATPRDLGRQNCLSLALQPNAVWYCRRTDAPNAEPLPVPVDGSLRANDSEALLAAAKSGLGVALLPSWLAAEDLQAGELVGLLTDWDWTIAAGPAPAIWGMYPPKKVVAPKVRAFLDFMAGRIGAPPYWDRTPAR